MSEDLKGSEMFRLAIWFGLVTSLAEIILTLLFDWLGWMHWRALWALIPEIAIFAPVLYVPLFCILGLAFLVGGRLIPWLKRVEGAVFGFGCLLAFDLLVFSGHIRGITVHPMAVGLILAVATICLALAGSRFVARRELSFKHFSRASLKWVALATAAICLCAPGWLQLREYIATSSLPLPSAESPNVLVVVVDTLRADHLSSYGYTRNTSPNIDQLALAAPV